MHTYIHTYIHTRLRTLSPLSLPLPVISRSVFLQFRCVLLGLSGAELGGGGSAWVISFITLLRSFVSKVVAHWPETCLKGRRTLNQ
jgi:hypothetical protein